MSFSRRASLRSERDNPLNWRSLPAVFVFFLLVESFVAINKWFPDLSVFQQVRGL